MKRLFDLDSATLHVMAMMCMLCDHLWATIIPGWDWLTVVGRLTFPLYAFFLTEGYIHTRNRKKYALRMLIFAFLSEIPYNLMTMDLPIFPFQQNVMWTLLLGLGLIHVNERARAKGAVWLRIACGVLTTAGGYLIGQIAMLDYGGAGILIILMFYFLRQRTWWCLAAQAVVLFVISTELIMGLYYEIPLFGMTLKLYRQCFCLLALIPIWLYRGRQGHSSKLFRWICYGFYPVHMLVLYGLRLWLL